MSTLTDLLAEIVADPVEETHWLVLADWLEEHDDVRRGELLRLHRKLLATCCEPEDHPERGVWQARIIELIADDVRPCGPQETVSLPGGVSLTVSFIPPGAFLMGWNGNDNEKPVHKVTLPNGYFIGVHPVTQEQWKTVMNSDPSHFKGPNRPVEGVSWDDCQEFCERLTAEFKGHRRVRLPTEAEWEWACRAGTTTAYHYGDTINAELVNYNGNHSWNDSPKGKDRAETTDVALFPANPWGLYDVHGNVLEWCSDWHGDYSPAEQTDPQGNPTGETRVLRGGGWLSTPEHCRSAGRYGMVPSRRFDVCGCRVCFRLE